ncbi:MAG: exodeoxyribonuclease VII large subunit, partial [Desulfobia sp.]
FKGQRPDIQIAHQRFQLRTESERLVIFMQRQLENKRNRLTNITSRLEAVSPLAVLERGYAIVSRLPGQEIIEDSGQVEEGDRVEIKLHKGVVRGRLTEITRNTKKQP